MRIWGEKVKLELIEPFVISHSKITYLHHIFVHIEDKSGIHAVGEIVPVEFFGEFVDTAWIQLQEMIAEIEKSEIEFVSLGQVKKAVKELNTKHYYKCVICGMEMLFIHYLCQRMNLNVWEILSLNQPVPRMTPKTVTILEAHRAIDAKEQFIKIKLGSPRDLEYLEFVKNNQDKKFILDVNQGWDMEDIQKYQSYFSLDNILFLEEPMKITDVKDLEFMRQYIGETKIFLDESIRSMDDAKRYLDFIDGVNIKIVKIGGLLNSLEIAGLLKSKNKQIMLGCFLESSLSITYAYHISECFDYVDLDGATFLKDNPYTGVIITDGKIQFEHGKTWRDFE